MKLHLQIFILLFITLQCYSQDWYESSLKISNKTADTTQDSQTLNYLLVYYQRLAESEPRLWMPYYYQAYIHYRFATCSAGLNRPQEHLEKAFRYASYLKSNFKSNTEIDALYALIATICMERGTIETTSEHNSVIRKVIDTSSANPRMIIAHTMYLFTDPAANKQILLQMELELLHIQNNAFSVFQGNEYTPSWGCTEIEFLLNRIKELHKNNSDSI